MKEGYREISADLLALAHGNAWSIENMEAHEAGGRSVEYIGSRTEGNIVYDYYRDSAGAFWYQNRAIVNGEIVSMEKYIFGHEVSRKPGAEMVERKTDNEEICSRSRDSRKTADKVSTSEGRSDSAPELYYGQV